MAEILIIPTEDPSLIVRELVVEDAEAYYDAVHASSKHLSVFEPRIIQEYPTVAAVEKEISTQECWEQHMGIWAEDQFAGSIDLWEDVRDARSAEIGYWINEQHTGKGYATLAVRALTAYNERQYHRIWARVVMGNFASARVLEKSGFDRGRFFRHARVQYQSFERYTGRNIC